MSLERIFELKTITWYFDQVLKGEKDFEVRINDREFRRGDILILKEWDNQKYTGRTITKKIKYILPLTRLFKKVIADMWWTQEEIDQYGVVILGLQDHIVENPFAEPFEPRFVNLSKKRN